MGVQVDEVRVGSRRRILEAQPKPAPSLLIDVRLDHQGQVNFIEVNPLAGIHPEHSDLPMMATMVGMSYTALIGNIMKSALPRCHAAVRAASLAA